MTPVRIRPAAPGEAGCLADLYAAAFSEPFTLPAVEILLASSGAWALIAEAGKGGEPVGFAIARAVAEEVEILSLGVVPAARRRGVARLLLRAVCDRLDATAAARLYLEVGADNPPALALYRESGFETVGRRRGYYRRAGGRRVDALIMCLALKNSGSNKN